MGHLKSESIGKSSLTWNRTDRTDKNVLPTSGLRFPMVDRLPDKCLHAKISLWIVRGDAGHMGELARLRNLWFLWQWGRLWSFALFPFPSRHTQRNVLRIANQSFDARPNVTGRLIRIKTETNHFGMICKYGNVRIDVIDSKNLCIIQWSTHQLTST